METNDATAVPPPAPSGIPSAEDRQWGMFAHLSALSGVIIPFGNIIGPLVVWQIKKDTLPFAAEQGKEALNFNITALIAAAIGFLLTFVLIGLVLLPLIGIAWLVLTILAGIKANEGVAYRYPFALRLIK
ncbi:MAG TPA: DUF4870 domain-containing protein [Thermomonas sp.]|nr:DUF4870 domain-containing protein [Thermomonas sp.]